MANYFQIKHARTFMVMSELSGCAGHTCDPSTWEAEAGDHEFQASLGCIEKKGKREGEGVRKAGCQWLTPIIPATWGS
jgi:hypothetical protein